MSNTTVDARKGQIESRPSPSNLERLICGRDLKVVLEQLIKRFGLSREDVASIAQVEASNLWWTVHVGDFAVEHAARLLWRIQRDRGLEPEEYQVWRKALYMATFLRFQYRRGLAMGLFCWDPQVVTGLYPAVVKAYDEAVKSGAAVRRALSAFARTWEAKWAWIPVPTAFRVIRAGENGYDLQASRPYFLARGRLRRLGAGFRAESKGWGTGAYRVYRVSTEPLDSPEQFEPALVHVPARHEGEQSEESDLAEFWIGRYPVTVAQFAYFVDHHGYLTKAEEGFSCHGRNWRRPAGEGRSIQEYGRHPVTMVSREDALAYCRWLSSVTGKAYSLPTRAQWKKAALGTDGRRHPWGDAEPDRTHCNIERWFEGTTPVGQFSPAGDGPKFDNPYGCADMVGNVSEWSIDLHHASYIVYQDCDPNFPVPKSSTSTVVCGASWRVGLQFLRPYQCTNNSADDVGFRVVVNPSSQPTSAA